MSYKSTIKEYQSSGMGSEKKLWGAMECLEDCMEWVKVNNPELHNRTIRQLHEIYCGPHYSESLARHDVSQMRHKDKSGQVYEGEHWNINQTRDVVRGISMPAGTTIWDVYVAINANWHDKCKTFAEWFESDLDKKIIEDAINFYFKDDDAPENKLWLYMEAIK